MSRLLILALLIVLPSEQRGPWWRFFRAPAVAAADWFVSTTGNNSNACSDAGAPCLTFAGVQAKAIACGDIIEFAAGDYSNEALDRQDITKSGCAGNPIVYRGYGASGCPVTASATTRAGFTVLTDPHHPTNVRVNPDVIIDRWRFQASYVTIDCFRIQQTGSFNDAFYIEGVDRVGLSIIRNYVDGVSPSQCRNGLNADNSDRTDLPTNLYVARNYIKDCTIGIAASGHTILVELNEIHGLTSTTRDYMRAGGNFITMRRNYAYGANLDGCPTCHIDCVQGFILTDVGDHQFQDFVFDRNSCFNAHQGSITEDQSSGSRGYTGRIQRHRYTNNVIADGVDPADPLAPGAWCLSVGSAEGVVFYHNTCSNFLNGIGGGDGLVATIKNNLVMATINPTSIDKTSSATQEDNLFFSPACDGGLTIVAPVCGLTHSGVSFPNDILNVDPLVTSRPLLNFRLLSGSPAINVGAAGTGVSVDRNGTSRAGRIDIGAYHAATP